MARGYYLETKYRKMIERDDDLCKCFSWNWDDFCVRVDHWQGYLNDYFKHEVDHFDDIVSFMKREDDSSLAGIAEKVGRNYDELLRIFIKAAYNSINELTDPEMDMQEWKCTLLKE